MPGAVGRLVFRIIGRDETGPASRSAQQNMRDTEAAIAKIKAAGAAMGVAVVGALTRMAASAREAVAGVRDLSNSLGVSVEEADRLAFAARRGGIELNDLRGVLQRINEIVQVDAADSADVAGLLRRIGIDPDDPALKEKTVAELAQFYADVFAGAGREGAAIAESLGITGEDLSLILNLDVQLGRGGDGGIDTADVLDKAAIDAVLADAEQVGIDIGRTLNDGIAGIAGRGGILSRLGQSVDDFGDVGGLLFGLTPQNAAKQFVETFGAEYELRTAAEVERLFTQVLPFFEKLGEDLGARLGSESVQQFVKLLVDTKIRELDNRSVAQVLSDVYTGSVAAETLDDFEAAAPTAAAFGGGRTITDFDRRAHARYASGGGRLTISNWIAAGRPAAPNPDGEAGLTGVGAPQSARGFIDRFGLANNRAVVDAIAAEGTFTGSLAPLTTGPLASALNNVSSDLLAQIVALLEEGLRRDDQGNAFIRLGG